MLNMNEGEEVIGVHFIGRMRMRIRSWEEEEEKKKVNREKEGRKNGKGWLMIVKAIRCDGGS